MTVQGTQTDKITPRPHPSFDAIATIRWYECVKTRGKLKKFAHRSTLLQVIFHFSEKRQRVYTISYAMCVECFVVWDAPSARKGSPTHYYYSLASVDVAVVVVISNKISILFRTHCTNRWKLISLPLIVFTKLSFNSFLRSRSLFCFPRLLKLKKCPGTHTHRTLHRRRPSHCRHRVAFSRRRKEECIYIR